MRMSYQRSILSNTLALSSKDTGKVGGKLLGIVTSRDIDYLEEKDWDTTIDQVMTPAEKLIVGNADLSLETANEKMQAARKGVLGEPCSWPFMFICSFTAFPSFFFNRQAADCQRQL